MDPIKVVPTVSQQGYLEQLQMQKLQLTQHLQQVTVAVNTAATAILRGHLDPDADEYKGWTLMIERDGLIYTPPA